MCRRASNKKHFFLNSLCIAWIVVKSRLDVYLNSFIIISELIIFASIACMQCIR